MLLICYKPFGNDKPGDSVEVADGAEYDHAYYHEGLPKKKKSSDELPKESPLNPPAADAGENE